MVVPYNTHKQCYLQKSLKMSIITTKLIIVLLFQCAIFSPPRNQWEKEFCHSSPFFSEYRVIFPKQLIMRTSDCFYGISIFFFLLLVVWKQAGFSHFCFFSPVISTWQVGANVTHFPWNRIIDDMHSSTKDYFNLSFRFVLDIKYKGSDKKYLRMTAENVLFLIQRDLLTKKSQPSNPIRTCQTTGQNNRYELLPFNCIPF